MRPPEGAGTSSTSAGADAVPVGSVGTSKGAAPPAAGHDPALVATEESSRAYVAPQALPKVALPIDPQPEAKVVLNLPADPVAAVSEDEVRAARARRRTATVKIERATVQETLKAADLATAAAALTAAEEAAGKSHPPGPLAQAPIVAEARHVSPVPRPAVEFPMPPAVASERDLDADADMPLPKKGYGRLVGVVLVAAIAGAAFYVTQNGLPGSATPPAATPAAETAPTTVAAQPSATTETAAAPPTPDPAAADTSTLGAVAPHPAAPVGSARPGLGGDTPRPGPGGDTPRPGAQRTPPPPATTAPRPPRPPPPLTKPATKPKGDIPSEI